MVLGESAIHFTVEGGGSRLVGFSFYIWNVNVGLEGFLMTFFVDELGSFGCKFSCGTVLLDN